MNRNIVTGKEAAAARAVMGKGYVTAKPTADTYADRLVKYIPPDIIGAFTAIEGLVDSGGGTKRAILAWVVFTVILVATPAYLIRVAGVRKISQVVISTAAFIVWAFAYPGEPFLSLNIDRVWGSVILALFTFLIPLVTV
jgi:hypothetical protein